MFKKYTFPLIALFFFTSTCLAYASEAGHEANWGGLFYRIGNFVLFAGILWYFAGKKAILFFKNRTDSIANSLSDFEKQKELAMQELSVMEERMKKLDIECTAIIDEYKKQGEFLKRTIVENAEKEAEAILEQAKATALNEVLLSKEAIYEEISLLVIKKAEDILSEKLSSEDHKNLIDSYLKKVVLN